MINYKIIILLLISPFIISNGLRQNKKSPNPEEDKWSGTVSYFEKRTGPKIVISEWKMDAIITNNKGTGTNKIKSEVTDEGKSNCFGQDSSELDVGIDLVKKTYSIFVTIPDCNGLTISASRAELKYVQDGSIMINDQPLGTNRNVLSGNLVLKDGPDANGSLVITTYTWNLKKTK